MRDDNLKFLVGVLVGAAGGFAVGSIAATPTVRSAGQSALGSLDVYARCVGMSTVKAVHELSSAVESGYTRVRGREKYLEHEIEELRDQITRLELRID